MERGRLMKEVAAERVFILYKLALEQAGRNPELSSGYVKTLRRISAHYKVSIPDDIKGRICKKCNLVLIPGLTAKVRIASSKGYVVYACNKCGNENHLFYKGRSPELKKVKKVIVDS
jgi:ribonuclease P protein subunit RPR2